MTDKLSSLFSLAGRTALVTGGTSGIGEMIARGLLIAGAKVFITGRTWGTAEAKSDELGRYGECNAIVGDLMSEEGRTAVVSSVQENASDLSILINNAGVTARNPLGAYTEQQWDSVYDLNVKALFLLTQDLVGILRSNATQQLPSQILNVGSSAALSSQTPDSFAYGGSKAAVHHLTRVLARKLAPDSIHVNAIAPGLFPSKMSSWIVDDEEIIKTAVGGIPVGRIGEADDMASLVIAIVSNRYLTGDIISIDGGLTL